MNLTHSKVKLKSFFFILVLGKKKYGNETFRGSVNEGGQMHFCLSFAKFKNNTPANCGIV